MILNMPFNLGTNSIADHLTAISNGSICSFILQSQFLINKASCTTSIYQNTDTPYLHHPLELNGFSLYDFRKCTERDIYSLTRMSSVLILFPKSIQELYIIFFVIY
ncbi:hypothetical protein ACH5RR_025055 [Cinchona calisaya]|uniref:Uncharacterized protein n=1 Tax=Cinchona calisaya TaxID=153742 RepID=A0ABD2YYI4_9GENT